MLPEPHAPLVLIADDLSSNLQFIAQVLDQAGYAVISALGSEQAVARARARKPDLVLLDMRMPGMDGSTCRALRAAGLADVPIIFITDASERSARIEAFAAGAVDCVVKPFIVEELLARVRTHLDLKLARDRMAAMLREREEVMQVVAHDLKNPLSCALFAAQLMRSSGDAQQRTRLLDEIIGNSEEALRFIQRFLSRGAESQRLRQLQPGTLALRDTAARAISAQQPAAETRGMRIALRGEARACADPDVTRNVIQNLLSNAIRYAPARSLIEVEIDSSPAGHARLRVLDRGPGIAAEQRARLFRSFVRLYAGAGDEELSAQPAYSSGLGLAIAKHDVTRMGGNLWYEPRAGGGAMFAFELPQQREAAGVLG